MRKFFIALNKYYNNYKIVIWIIVIAIVLFLLVTNAMDKILKENSNSSSVNNTTTIVAINEKDSTSNTIFNDLASTNNVSNAVTEKTDSEIINEISSNENAIKVFVDFCNSSKLDSAYSMLSDDCKEILYPTKSDFISNYYNAYFAEPKNVYINKYNKQKTYKVDFKLDSILTGGSNTGNKIDYITVNSDYKLNISSFIRKKQVGKSAKNSYLKVNVLNEYVFLNYENYEIEVENFTSADMILGNADDGSSTYLVDTNNNYFYLDINNNEENELKVSGNKSKNIKLQFSKEYKEDTNVLKMVFNNIEIKNYEYLDSNVGTDTSQEVIYERRTTTYPNTISLQVSFL